MAKSVFVLMAILCLSTNLFSQAFTNIGPSHELWHQDLSPDFGSGVSLVDVNQDGWDDITLLRGGVGIRFYLNNHDGFDEVALNVNLPYDLKQACWVDIDNNGLRDLAITCYGGPFKVYQNTGDLNLVDVSTSTNIYEESYLTYAQSWADYDRDGDLDLYISNYNASEFGDPSIENFLYANNGDFTFTDVTAVAGVGNGSTETLAATWFDHNNDMWPDLMIANDRGYTPNALYLNNTDGTFTEISQATNTHIFIDAMGLAIDDFSGDDHDDIYVTNNWGNRLHKSTGGAYMEANTLFDDNVDFLSWGASWLDYDCDGLLDLYVAVDYYLTQENYSRIYRQETDGTFYKVPTGSYLLEDQGHCYGSAIGDFNNDGRQDISVVSSPPYYTRFWQNNILENNWLKCSLLGTVSNRDAVGSTIRCYSQNHQSRQVVRCGESYLSQNSFTEFFGVGSDELVDSLIVQWPSGLVDKWYNIPVNQSLSLVEGQGISLVYSAEHPVRLCNNAVVQLAIENEDLINVHWNVDYTGPVLYMNEPGAYVAAFEDSYGNLFLSDTVFAAYASAPTALWQYDVPLCADESGLFQMLDSDNYEWHIDGVTGADSTSIALANGQNELILFDINGCSFTYNVDVAIPQPLAVNMQITSATCYGQCDGHINISASGGTGNYTWSSPNPNTLFWCAGDHELTVTDENGCTKEIEFTMGQPQPIVIQPIITEPSCFGDTNGLIDLDISGGTGSYQIFADFLIGEEISAGNYTIIVEDAAGCLMEQSIVLNQPQPLTVEAVVVNDIEGQGLGGIAVAPGGGNAPFTYWWSNGAGNTSVVNGLFTGSYTVQVIDANGCSEMQTFVINNSTGVEDSPDERWMIYPNPANDFFQYPMDPSITKVTIYDMYGKSVLLEWPQDGQVNCQEWARGCYTIVFNMGESTLLQRLLLN
jgi:ASPIC and UnbV/FG-GAP-like repeat/Secretion system C-terminal sorting domain/SprB repeat